MFAQPYFWCCCFVTAIFYRSLDCRFVRGRGAILSIFSSLCLSALLSAFDLLALALIVLWTWFMGNRLCTLRPRGIRAPLCAILPIAGYWITGKHDLVDFASNKWLTFFGMSFVLVKCWTLFKDCEDNRIANLRLETVCSYLTFFPCFVMGPIHTYNDFKQALEKNCELDARALIDIYFRIAVGLMKIYVIAPFMSPFSLLAVPGHQFSLDAILPIVLGAFVYSLVIYCDFSGYSDLAISTARIIGIKTPENFNYPYFAPSIREFWNRWHISFSRILTQYLFIPVSRALSTRYRNNRITVMITGYLITFLICGYWHGPTINFVIWGLYHAAGLIVYDLYRSTRQYKPQKSEANYFNRVFCVLLTFAFVSLGWIPFVLGGK